MSIVTGDSDLELSTVYTPPTHFLESLPGRSNWCLPQLPLRTHAEEVIPTFSTSKTYIGLSRPKALTLPRLGSYKLFRNNITVDLRGIHLFPRLRDTFLHRPAQGIPLKEGVQ
jgi:hypothetical protein